METGTGNCFFLKFRTNILLEHSKLFLLFRSDVYSFSIFGMLCISFWSVQNPCIQYSSWCVLLFLFVEFSCSFNHGTIDVVSLHLQAFDNITNAYHSVDNLYLPKVVQLLKGLCVNLKWKTVYMTVVQI